MKLDSYQKKQIEKAKEEGKAVDKDKVLRDLEIIIEYHYKKRTLDQNALMWALYTIEANEMNGGQSGHSDQLVTAMELYRTDLEQHGERETVTTRRKHLGYYCSTYRVIEGVILDDGREMTVKQLKAIDMHGDDRITIRVVRGSSLFNTREMCYWIDRIFNRLAHHGVSVTDPGEIPMYWKKWRQFMNDSKIVLHDSIMTQEEYKAFRPICEACGEYIDPGTGHLFHIKAIGAGRSRKKEPRRNYTSNWLHTHAEPCHLTHWHVDAPKKFLKLYPHLAYKINTALVRNYEPLPDERVMADPHKTDEEKAKAVVENTKEVCKEQVLKLYESGKIEKGEACLQLEKLGEDPKVIDPNWVGIF